MGFGTAVTGSLFILTLVAVSALLFTSIVDVSVSSAEVLEQKAKQTQSRIDIQTVDMNTQNVSGTNITTITTTVENTGETIYNSSTVDLYIDEQRESRTNTTTTLNTTLDVTNPGLWDPGEYLLVATERETTSLPSVIRIKVATETGATSTTVEETP